MFQDFFKMLQKISEVFQKSPKIDPVLWLKLKPRWGKWSKDHFNEHTHTQHRNGNLSITCQSKQKINGLMRDSSFLIVLFLHKTHTNIRPNEGTKKTTNRHINVFKTYQYIASTHTHTKLESTWDLQKGRTKKKGKEMLNVSTCFSILIRFAWFTFSNAIFLLEVESVQFSGSLWCCCCCCCVSLQKINGFIFWIRFL